MNFRDVNISHHHLLPVIKFTTVFLLFSVFAKAEDLLALRSQLIAIPFVLALSGVVIHDVLCHSDLRIAFTKIILIQSLLSFTLFIALVNELYAISDITLIILVQAIFLDLLLYSSDSDAQKKFAKLVIGFEVIIIAVLIASLLKYNKLLMCYSILIFRIVMSMVIIKKLHLSYKMIMKPRLSLDFILPRLTSAIAISFLGTSVNNIMQFSLFVRVKGLFDILIPIIIGSASKTLFLITSIIVPVFFYAYIIILNLDNYIENIILFTLCGLGVFFLSISSQVFVNRAVKGQFSIGLIGHLVFLCSCIVSLFLGLTTSIEYLYFFFAGIAFNLIVLYQWRSRK